MPFVSVRSLFPRCGAVLLTCHSPVAHTHQAAEELTGQQPLPLWAAPHTAALADLLLLPPPHVTSGAGGGGGGARGRRGGGSASPSGALELTAVLLLGPEAACRCVGCRLQAVMGMRAEASGDRRMEQGTAAGECEVRA